MCDLGGWTDTDRCAVDPDNLVYDKHPLIKAAIDLMKVPDDCNLHVNTQVQRTLHPDLVCDAFETIIEIAASHKALGCKVNGAGGNGGSLAILTNGDMARKRRLLEALTTRGYQPLPVYLSRQGPRVWESR